MISLHPAKSSALWCSSFREPTHLIVNIIDLRENSYKWAKVLATAEDAGRATEAKDGDRLKMEPSVAIDYAERESVSVHEAIQWAEYLPSPVVLTLYDHEADAG